ncbi:superoxide dismutase [Brucella anthropi]|nr:superoxide dismutase [Brucella anthropi]
MLQGTVFRVALDGQHFEIFSEAGANGLASSTGLKINEETRQLVVCGGVTGLVHVFNVDTGTLVGRYSNGLIEGAPASVAPNPAAPTFVNDVAFAGGDAFITDSYHPVLYRLSAAALAQGTAAQLGQLEPWLPLDGTPIVYQEDGTSPGRFNLNGILATPDERFLIVVQTNTAKLFRISTATREIIEIKGQGNLGGDGLAYLSDTEILAIDMSKKRSLTRLRLSLDYDAYELIGYYDMPDNVSPTAGLVIDGELLLTESQIIDVLFTGKPEHQPYRVLKYPLSSVAG